MRKRQKERERSSTFHVRPSLYVLPLSFISAAGRETKTGRLAPIALCTLLIALKFQAARNTVEKKLHKPFLPRQHAESNLVIPSLHECDYYKSVYFQEIRATYQSARDNGNWIPSSSTSPFSTVHPSCHHLHHSPAPSPSHHLRSSPLPLGYCSTVHKQSYSPA